MGVTCKIKMATSTHQEDARHLDGNSPGDDHLTSAHCACRGAERLGTRRLRATDDELPLSRFVHSSLWWKMVANFWVFR